jgi:hypothetical protein
VYLGAPCPLQTSLGTGDLQVVHPMMSYDHTVCRDKPQNNDYYRALTALVQHSDYRECSHRHNVASSHAFKMDWLYRSPIAVWTEGGGVFYLLKLFLPACAAATGGGGAGGGETAPCEIKTCCSP